MALNFHKSQNNYSSIHRYVSAFIGVFIAIYAAYFASIAGDGFTLFGFGIVVASSSSFVALSWKPQRARK